MNRRKPHPRWGFLTPLYLLGVALHRHIYEWKIIVPFLPSQPTLTLGNLHAGGTGKTPIALWILEQIQPQVSDVAYVARGYGRKTKETRRVELQDTAEEVGDEPRLVRSVFGHSPDVHVIVAHKRRDAFQMLPKNCPVILDDAMQHWDLKSPITLARSGWACLRSGDQQMPAPPRCPRAPCHRDQAGIAKRSAPFCRTGGDG